jgi:hypothetical protein
MDLKALLGKLDVLEGSMEKAAKNPTGPKFTGQWRGTDKGTPGKKLVGDSILKDLSKGKTPKSKEQELSEEFQAFLEAEFKDTVDRRPARKNARPARGHEPQSGYKTIKAEEGIGQEYTVIIDRKGREKPVTGTMEELLDYFGYTLETGKSYEHERGRYKINLNPKNAEQLVDALNKAATNAAANSSPSTYYSVGEGQVAEGWESGPPEYKEPYDDADDAYERQRQEKIDTEAEKEWAKLPKVITYKLLGRGPKMEPNWDFGGTEYPSQEAAIEARAKLMADPNTPYPEHIGIQTITRVKDQTNEAVTPPGSGIVKTLDDYVRRRDEIYRALADPKQRDNYPWYKQALYDLNRMAKQAGLKIEESRAHKQLATWFANRERLEKFGKGELNIPTPQERQAQLKKSEKSKDKNQVKEYGANNVSPYGQPTIDPKQAATIAHGAQAIKSASGSTAPTTNLAKAIDAASQGKPIGQADMKILEPIMKDVKTIMQTPKIADGAFKTALQQANQENLKLQQQTKK